MKCFFYSFLILFFVACTDDTTTSSDSGDSTSNTPGTNDSSGAANINRAKVKGSDEMVDRYRNKLISVFYDAGTEDKKNVWAYADAAELRGAFTNIDLNAVVELVTAVDSRGLVEVPTILMRINGEYLNVPESSGLCPDPPGCKPDRFDKNSKKFIDWVTKYRQKEVVIKNANIKEDEDKSTIWSLFNTSQLQSAFKNLEDGAVVEFITAAHLGTNEPQIIIRISDTPEIFPVSSGLCPLPDGCKPNKKQ